METADMELADQACVMLCLAQRSGRTMNGNLQAEQLPHASFVIE